MILTTLVQNTNDTMAVAMICLHNVLFQFFYNATMHCGLPSDDDKTPPTRHVGRPPKTGAN